jgi:hypothetical protein
MMKNNAPCRNAEIPTEKNPESLISKDQPSWTQRYLKGWRFGVLNGAILATIVFIINVATTAYANTRKYGLNLDSRKTLFEGDCEKARMLNVYTHLLINVLSTVLLGACNYAMQCLSAPTRSDVDVAHSKRIWLDIGVFSVKNIGKINKTRSYLWVLLGISSLPLHLL